MPKDGEKNRSGDKKRKSKKKNDDKEDIPLQGMYRKCFRFGNIHFGISMRDLRYIYIWDWEVWDS